MSDCKHDWNFWPSSGMFVCYKCSNSTPALMMADRKEKAEARVKELEDFRTRYCKLQESLGDVLPQWQLDAVISDFKKRTEKDDD